MTLENVGDTEYVVVKGYAERVFKVVKRERVIIDRDTTISTSSNEEDAQRIARALNEAEGL